MAYLRCWPVLYVSALMTLGACAPAAKCTSQPATAPASAAATEPAARPAAIPAFPGAEGFGAYTAGGRGGKVYVVTTLEDYDRDDQPIPGSLRAALESKEPTIILFAVGGNIELKRRLYIGHPYVTIAGQTAPGDGICLKGNSLSLSNGNHDVVIRYIRVRLGDVGRIGSGDAIGGRTCKNIILDHCSASWSIDECVSFYMNEDVTVQWCLVAESLYHSRHYKGEHGYGGIWGGDRASFHHNLLAHHSSRNPRFEEGLTDFRNNVIYNWGFKSAYGGEDGRINIIANYYKSGPATPRGVRNRIMELELTGQYYIAGNFVAGYPGVTADNWLGVRGRGDFPPGHRARKPFEVAPVTTQTPQEAYELVLATVGASLPRRDPVDARIIEEVRSGMAHFGGVWQQERGGLGIIDSQDQVGGWPELSSGPVLPDSDQDGMPDQWETAHGLNPADASDSSGDRDGDGYTNIEEYIDSLAQPLITCP